jgi:uncharacterized protein (TIGR03086 family)
MEPIEQLALIIPTLKVTVDQIQGMQLDDPTPCDGWTVHDVLDHMLVLGNTFAHLFRGVEPPEPEPPVVYGWVPAAEFRKVMDDLLDAVKSPRAMDRVIATPLGELPGRMFARFVAFDGLVHGWDLATATGLRFDVPVPLVNAVDGFARHAITDEMRSAGMFRDPITPPPDASPLERLAAFTGRSI